MKQWIVLLALTTIATALLGTLGVLGGAGRIVPAVSGAVLVIAIVASRTIVHRDRAFQASGGQADLPTSPGGRR